MNDIDVGKKIAEFRKSKGLSMKQLSELTNVTPSMLSQIERGLANPSLNTLKSMAKALDIPLFTLFTIDANTDDLVVRSNMRKKITFAENNDFSYELLSPDLNGAIEFVLMKLSPGFQSSDELMSHNGEEVAYVVSGKVDIHIENKVITLENGDSIKLVPHIKHRWKNEYSEETQVVFAITPPSF